MTARQLEARELLDQGLNYAEIAERLGLAYMTVYYRLHPEKKREYLSARRSRRGLKRWQVCSACRGPGHNRRSCEAGCG